MSLPYFFPVLPPLLYYWRCDMQLTKWKKYLIFLEKGEGQVCVLLDTQILFSPNIWRVSIIVDIQSYCYWKVFIITSPLTKLKPLPDCKVYCFRHQSQRVKDFFLPAFGISNKWKIKSRTCWPYSLGCSTCTLKIASCGFLDECLIIIKGMSRLML